MVSSFGLNSAYNYNYSNVFQSGFRANSPVSSPSIFTTNPVLNPIKSQEQTNLIDLYLQNQGIYNTPLIKGNNRVSTPSGIGNYNNYVETDAYGKEIVSVKYSQTGNAITQNLKTTSPDGTTMEKVTTNDNGVNKMSLCIKDKSGKVLLQKDKSYEKLSDDTARTTVNGDVYNISGLSGELISVEHNGEVTTLDLRKMTDEKVEKMSVTRSADGNSEDESFENRPEKITDNEREILYSKIKSMGGDDLIRMSKCVDELAFLDAPDGCLESFYNKRALIYSKDIKSLVILHELGHGVNHAKSDEKLLSDSAHYKNIREYEIKNFRQNKSSEDERFNAKFTDSNRLLGRGYETLDDAEHLLRDETFAESYAVLNQTDIMNFDENIGDRTLSLAKYMLRTLVQVEHLS